MGIMGFLRNRAGAIIIIFIGVAIVAFLLSDVVRSGSGFIADAQSEVGEVAGEGISYKEFNDRVDQNSQQFKAQMGSLNAQMQSYVVENTWNQFLSKVILEKQTAKLGLIVGQTELYDLIFGTNPSAQIQQIFKNPQTGEFDRATAISSRKTADTNPELMNQWVSLEESIQQEKINQKYLALVKNGIYANSLEAKDDYTNRNRLVNFTYVTQDYASYPDADVKLTDDDYKTYYNENKFRYKNQTETRTFEYVVFNASPSKKDSLEAKAKIDKITEGFKTSTNDSLYVAINSDTKAPISYVKKGTLEPELDSVMFNLPIGSVYGPFLSNGVYKVAKLIDSRTSPDSVKARHILINPATEGGIDKATKKADSLKTLIQKGTSFAELAAKYGTDASKDKGGDLGTFGRGAMIPEFETAAFNGKPGELKVLKTQYGVHVIEIQNQIGSSKVVKVATVDKTLTPSAETERQAYQTAQTFLAEAKNAESFEKEAVKLKVQKLVAEDATPLQASLPGLEEARSLIKWAYKADKGAISDEIFDLGDKYVVAILTKIKPEGTLSLEDVKTQIEPLVKNKVKAKLITDKFQKAIEGASNINQLASKLGKQATPVENVVFANPVIPGISQENKVVGAIFGSQPNKLSKPIEGDKGVYIYQVRSFTNPPAFNNVAKTKEQLMQNLSSQVDGAIFQVLRKKANIKDNRVKFY